MLSLVAALLLAAAAVPSAAGPASVLPARGGQQWRPAQKAGLSLLGSVPFPAAEQVSRAGVVQGHMDPHARSGACCRCSRNRGGSEAHMPRCNGKGLARHHALVISTGSALSKPDISQVAFDDKAKVAYIIGGNALAVRSMRLPTSGNLPPASLLTCMSPRTACSQPTAKPF